MHTSPDREASLRSSPQTQASPSSPRFTVVVPTYNRLASLTTCLEAIAAQDFPRDEFEVVVVDDGSASPPRALIGRLSDNVQVRLIEQANAGPAAARNAGARAARGQYLAFTDDDCQPGPGWLRALDQALAEHPDAAIGGAVISSLRNPFSTASQLLVDFLYDYFERDNQDGQFFVTANVAMPAALFRELGGFDLTFPLAAAEDRDLCERWHERGFGLVFSEAAFVWHAHRLNLRSFCRQHFNYGRGAWFLNKAKHRRGRQGLQVPPLRFYSALVLFPLSKAPWPGNLALAVLVALSQLAYVVGYLREKTTDRSVAPESTGGSA